MSTMKYHLIKQCVVGWASLPLYPWKPNQDHELIVTPLDCGWNKTFPNIFYKKSIKKDKLKLLGLIRKKSWNKLKFGRILDIP